MSNAPVCHISTNQGVIEQPRPAKLPTIYPPVDLPSALAAINQLILMVQMLSGQLQSNTNGRNGAPGLPGRPGAPAQTQSSKVGRWNEITTKRVYQTVRIFQKDDHENYIDVQHINQVVMQDSVTGEQWIWKR